MKKLLTLFFSFLKIGFFAFGGGLVMFAFFEREFVDKRKWIDHDEFLDLIIISESTPGPIAVNAATFIGYKVSKFWGAVASTLGICVPSFSIIYVISLFFDAFLENQIIANAFRGIQVCVVYLILSAAFKIFKKIKKTPLSITVMVVTLCIMLCSSIFAWGLSSILFIFAGAIIGLATWVVTLIKEKGAQK